MLARVEEMTARGWCAADVRRAATRRCSP